MIANKARKISRGFVDRIHIHVDASFEPDGFSGLGGLGGLCVNSIGKVLGFFSEQVPSELLELIKAGDEEAAIQELEMVAIVIVLEVWKETLSTHRVVVFTDSEAVRSSILKCSSKNSFVDRLPRHLFQVEEHMEFQIWLKKFLVRQPS